LNYFPALSIGGDYARVIANAIRYCSRQSDPVLKTMPIELAPLKKIFKDDHPTTTTPIDSFPVTVEVRDDDHLKVEVQSQTELSFNDFNLVSQCSWSTVSRLWPPGWSSAPPQGWRCQAYSQLQGSRGGGIQYFYNDPLYGTGDGHSYVYTNTFDLSTYVGVRMNYYHYWQANFPTGTQDGYIQASLNGGATWITLQEYHHNAPALDSGNRMMESVAVGGASSVQFRFYYFSNNDWYWMFDNVRITGIVGEVMNGLGSADGVATVANVPPTIAGGFSSALRTESQGLRFEGFEISDPALIEPTEWFAWAVDMDVHIGWC
jgi:hypothetical protein